MSGLSGFAMPERFTVDEETATATYSRFFAEPLEQGFGNTLGNSLRRVLLSSLEGIAVSSIQIDGIAHEFTTIQDVIEDVTDVVLNFKKIRFLCDGEVPRTLELKVSKAGSITAGNIELDNTLVAGCSWRVSARSDEHARDHNCPRQGVREVSFHFDQSDVCGLKIARSYSQDLSSRHAVPELFDALRPELVHPQF